MSNVNIKRAVENIRSGTTTIYTPVIELVVNAIQSIDESQRKDGLIQIKVRRSAQQEIDGSLADIVGFSIIDNGVGFTDINRDSFDTLYSDRKIDQGGKGFGRFTCLKYFKEVKIESIYCNETGVFMGRSFSMGDVNDIIVHEECFSSPANDSKTIVKLDRLIGKVTFEKNLIIFARNLVEKLLPYFITPDYICPKIVLSEEDGSGEIELNNFAGNGSESDIQELGAEQSFSISCEDLEEKFKVRVFKFYSPRNQRSRVSLTAHKREVSSEAIHKYIPEFIDEFYDSEQGDSSGRRRNYIIKAYVFGDYLNDHVSLERGGFEFTKDGDVFLKIGQVDIEQRAAEVARQAIGDEIVQRQEKKKEVVMEYIDKEAPWHKSIVRDIDLSALPYNADNLEIEIFLQKNKLEQEIEVKKEIQHVLANPTLNGQQEAVSEIVNKVTYTSKNDLIHYVAQRRTVINLLEKGLEKDATGKYHSEEFVHNIIFPLKGDSDITSFEDHNLWLLDERLNFTEYVSSDKPFVKTNTDRADLLIYGKRFMMREGNEASNPVTIFEFKKPQRDDFVNPSADEDPIQQIVRYVNSIREGKYKTPAGRDINVSSNTSFYGYVVCDLTQKVKKWLEYEKNFKQMPDGLGWFGWMDNINLYIEVLSWDKLVNDAKMRSRVFFKKLGIE